MGCRSIIHAGRVIGVACSRGRSRARKCSERGCEHAAGFQCDHAIEGRKRPTCDRWLCRQHATTVGHEVHWCPHHAKPETWDESKPMDIVNADTGEVIARRPAGHPMLDRAQAAGFLIEPTRQPAGGV